MFLLVLLARLWFIPENVLDLIELFNYQKHYVLAYYSTASRPRVLDLGNRKPRLLGTDELEKANKSRPVTLKHNKHTHGVYVVCIG